MTKIASYFDKFLSISKSSWSILRLFWKKYKKYIFLLFVLSVLISVLPFASSGTRGYLINKLIEAVTQKTGLNYEVSIAIVLALGVMFVIPYFNSFYSYIQKMLWFFVHERSEFMIYKKFGVLDIKQREDPKTNDLINTITENKWRINNFLDRIFYIFQNIIAIITALVIIFKFKWWASVIIIIGTFPEFIAGTKYAHFMWGIYDAKGEVKRKFWNLEYYLRDKEIAKETKIFQSAGYLLRKMKQLFKNFRKEEFKNEKRRIKYEFMALLVSQLSEAFVFFLFILDVLDGRMQVGTLAFVAGSVVNLRSSLNSFFMNLSKQYEDMLFINDIIRFLNLEKGMEEDRNSVILQKRCPEIKFDRVFFKYPFTNDYVLYDISFTINPGDKVAIIGENGAGKSTLIKLLCRFYDPTRGNIYINGYNLKDINLASWYRLLAVIFQEYGTYRFKVKESIAISRPDENIQNRRVEESAHLAGADRFIEKFERKYDQMLGVEFKDGVELSTGQWQKIALSRVFYRNSFVFVLDEPTSALDPLSEEEIFNILRKKTENKIVIFISHRFSTIRQADKIIVLDGGRIVEMGTHKELMENNGLYRKMFISQSKGYR